MPDLSSASQSSPPISQMGSEAKRGACTKPLSSKEGRAGSPAPTPSTQWAHGQGWRDESQERTRGPGTMTQLMSGAINTSAFPTAPTCLTRLPFLLMSGPGASGQNAWVGAENIT